MLSFMDVLGRNMDPFFLFSSRLMFMMKSFRDKLSTLKLYQEGSNNSKDKNLKDVDFYQSGNSKRRQLRNWLVLH